MDEAVDLEGINPKIIDALTELKQDVDNINGFGLHQDFRERVMAGDELPTVEVDGIVYGYRLHDRGQGIMEREVLVRPKAGGFRGMSEAERDELLLPVFQVFCDQGYTDAQIEVVQGTLQIRVKVQVAYLYERNPGIIVPSGRLING